jgi:menaquinone-dependent protoporphyrinogen IX oxidase
MNNVLVTYATMSGTTTDVAKAVAEELEKKGAAVSLVPLEQVNSLKGFDMVVLGAPMIVGWHRSALKFLKNHRDELAGKRLALFATAMSLTQTGETEVDGVPVYIDEKLAQIPRRIDKLSYKERFSAIPSYVRPMVKTAGTNKPVSVALFGGRLDIYRLKLWAALFVMIVIHTKPGEKRNWETIRAWAQSL